MNLTRRAALMTSAAIAANVIDPMRAFAQQTPRRGGVFTVHYGAEQRMLNPSLQASTGVYIIGGKIQEPLVDLDANGQPVGLLAESWESTPDGKTITFKLRRGVTWHDGKPFTSADVQFTAMEMWKKLLNYGSTLQLFLTAVDTPDPHTAIFRYERPMPLNLLLRALPDLGYISPKHLYDSGDIRQNPRNLAPVGTGPFKFVSYERGQHVIAEKNDNYWRGAPYLDRVIWRVITDRAAAAAQMEAGQLHYSPFSGLTISDMARLAKDPRFVVSTKGNEGNARTNTLEFNFRRKELADLKVRQALAHAINVPFFIENFLGDFAKAGTGPIPSVSTDFYPGADTPQYPYDKAKAMRLLDEAGLRPGAGGVRLTLRLLPAPWGEDISLWATFIQQSLGEVGVRVEVVRNDAAGFLRQVYAEHAFDLATGWHQYRNDPAVSTTVWYRSGQPAGAPWTNQWGVADATLDKIIDDAATEVDAAKRKALYADFVKRANGELMIWMPIEQIFVTTITAKARNHSNTPRWGSSTWHDLWLAE
ncbi:ABC transporter substrate-binding protein [Phreatobacter sp.]|uniref:ABC transporter substrate-binding protein n=1 Tax=Phreatobacter sp. TaxID=1966341 RepID=UPI003F6FC488